MKELKLECAEFPEDMLRVETDNGGRVYVKVNLEPRRFCLDLEPCITLDSNTAKQLRDYLNEFLEGQ